MTRERTSAPNFATLRLTDNIETKYEMVSPATGVIDGRASIEFKPAVPAGATRLHLSQPGWGLHIPTRPA